MKQRLYIAISYIVFGTALALLALITKSENQFLSAFGIALAVMGVLRIFQYRKITRSTDAMRKRELAETDEQISIELNLSRARVNQLRRLYMKKSA